MLSKKYYIAIANILKTCDRKEQIILELAHYFATDNPNFDMGRFMEACDECPIEKGK